MKRAISILLAAAALCSCAAAAGVADEKTEATAISFDMLEGLVAETNSDVINIGRAYEKMRLQLAYYEGKHRDLTDGGGPLEYLASAAMPLQDIMSELTNSLKDKDKDITDVFNGRLHAAKLMYLNYYLIYEQEILQRRDYDDALRELASLKRKRDTGIVSGDAVEAFEKIVKLKNDSLKSISKTAEADLRNFADFLGMLTEIKLEGLPEFDPQAVAKRDSDADLALYSLYCGDVRAKSSALDKAQKEYEKSSTAANRFAYNNAKSDYEKAREKAKLDFPFVFADLKDACEEHLTNTIVKDAENELGKLQRQFARGLVSKNNLLAAERALEDAKNALETERIMLIIRFTEYEFNLKKPEGPK
ncbi:MAG: hypothetical protein FWG32_05410 [Oscillospiraceae bacterium]|nr:hypothetical protein [Oscillospiraceae bacterium]